MTNNVLKGKEFVLSVQNDGETAFELIGGIRTRSVTFNNPTEETTSVTTQTSFTEREFTGFSDVSISGSGTADTRVGVTDNNSGLVIVGIERIAELATSNDRDGVFKLESVNAGLTMSIQGRFTITSFGLSGDTPGLLTFDLTLESKADITVTYS